MTRTEGRVFSSLEDFGPKDHLYRRLIGALGISFSSGSGTRRRTADLGPSRTDPARCLRRIRTGKGSVGVSTI